eukprot:5065893-Pyramimonas_sp.AAC.1
MSSEAAAEDAAVREVARVLAATSDAQCLQVCNPPHLRASAPPHLRTSAPPHLRTSAPLHLRTSAPPRLDER